METAKALKFSESKVKTTQPTEPESAPKTYGALKEELVNENEQVQLERRTN